MDWTTVKKPKVGKYHRTPFPAVNIHELGFHFNKAAWDLIGRDYKSVYQQRLLAVLLPATRD